MDMTSCAWFNHLRFDRETMQMGLQPLPWSTIGPTDRIFLQFPEEQILETRMDPPE